MNFYDKKFQLTPHVKRGKRVLFRKEKNKGKETVFGSWPLIRKEWNSRVIIDSGHSTKLFGVAVWYFVKSCFFKVFFN